MKGYYKFKKNILYFLIIFLSQISLANSIILNYQPTFIPGFDKLGHMQIAIRSYYKFNNKDNSYDLYFLNINPVTFVTSEVAASEFKTRRNVKGQAGYYNFAEIASTPYYKALIRYTSPPYELQNYGVINSKSKGNFLTIDMCPSSKPFESIFFNELVKIGENSHEPTNIAISISGLFIVTHKKEFEWLIEQERNNKLAITWINHSFSHVYYPDVPLKNNFLLFTQTNQDFEILQTEQLLLENDQLPSIFYRFPGLVSDKGLILKLRKYGLIPIGANAWLAKGEKIQPGSIILVHGNSNEHKGIELLMPKLSRLKLLKLQDAFK